MAVLLFYIHVQRSAVAAASFSISVRSKHVDMQFARLERGPDTSAFANWVTGEGLEWA